MWEPRCLGRPFLYRFDQSNTGYTTIKYLPRCTQSSVLSLPNNTNITSTNGISSSMDHAPVMVIHGCRSFSFVLADKTWRRIRYAPAQPDIPCCWVLVWAQRGAVYLPSTLRLDDFGKGCVRQVTSLPPDLSISTYLGT